MSTLHNHNTNYIEMREIVVTIIGIAGKGVHQGTLKHRMKVELSKSL